jgi:hypothetical protein
MNTLTVTRRNLLGSSILTGGALLAVTTGLAACTAAQVNNALVQAGTDAKLIGNGLLSVLPQLATVAGITPATLAAVQAAVTGIQTAATAIAAASSASAALPAVQSLEADFNAIIGALASVPLIPPPISTALQAASILLPIIEAAVGLVLPAQAVAPHAMATAPASMNTPDSARLFLGSL